MKGDAAEKIRLPQDKETFGKLPGIADAGHRHARADDERHGVVGIHRAQGDNQRRNARHVNQRAVNQAQHRPAADSNDYGHPHVKPHADRQMSQKNGR